MASRAYFTGFAIAMSVYHWPAKLNNLLTELISNLHQKKTKTRIHTPIPNTILQAPRAPFQVPL